MRKLATALALVAAAAGAASATDLHFVTSPTQAEFSKLTKEAGALIGYRMAAPTASLGITGFDAGVEVSAVSVDSGSAAWNKAFGNDAPSYFAVPKLRVRKGLPLGIDVGGMYAYVPGSNVKIVGAELSKSIIDGGIAMPSVGVRGTYSRLLGVGDLDLNTMGIDASISKGFVFITPYAGAGYTRISATPQGNLKSLPGAPGAETVWQPKVFGGVELKPFPLFRITADVEYSERVIYTLKASLGF